MNSSDPLNLAAFSPSDPIQGGQSKTQKRKKRRSNQGAASDDSVKVTPVKFMKTRSLVGIARDDVPRGQKSKLKHAPGTSYQQHKSDNASSCSSKSALSEDESSARLIYQPAAIGGSVNAVRDPRLHPDDVGKTFGRSFKKGASGGKAEAAQVLPYDPKAMASQCRRVVNFPSKMGQIAEVGKFKEQLADKDPVHGKSSDVLCSSKVAGMKRRKYSRMEDTWTDETSRVLNQTARVAAVVQARTINITFDVIKEYKEQVPDVFLMFKAAFNPEGWD